MGKADLKRDSLIDMSTVKHCDQHLAVAKSCTITFEDARLCDTLRNSFGEQLGKQQPITLR